MHDKLHRCERGLEIYCQATFEPSNCVITGTPNSCSLYSVHQLLIQCRWLKFKSSSCSLQDCSPQSMVPKVGAAFEANTKVKQHVTKKHLTIIYKMPAGSVLFRHEYYKISNCKQLRFALQIQVVSKPHKKQNLRCLTTNPCHNVKSYRDAMNIR